MTEQDKEQARLLETFRIEADEHIAQIIKDILALEKTGTWSEQEELLTNVLRHAHTLKGAARVTGLNSLVELIHTFESLGESLKSAGGELEQGNIDLLLQSMDMVQLLVESSSCSSGDDIDDDDLILALRQATSLNRHPLDHELDRVTSMVEEDAAGSPSSPDSLVEDCTYHYHTTANSSALGTHGTNREDGVAIKSIDGQQTVRISTQRLDNLINLIGELLVSKLRFERCLDSLTQLRGEVDGLNRDWLRIGHTTKLARRSNNNRHRERIIRLLDTHMSNLASFPSAFEQVHKDFYQELLRAAATIHELQDGVRKMRMLPLATVLDQFERLVRDMSRARKKKIELKVIGQQTRIDKNILEGIKDPLMHIISNAIEHGIETPRERQACGKPECATIEINAQQIGGNLMLTIADDGRGLNLSDIRRRAQELELVTQAELRGMDEKEAMFLIFRPGFSTSPHLTEYSGRGIGLDVVRQNIEALRGTVDVVSLCGDSTTFTLILPLTVTTMHGILVQLGEESYILPVDAIDRIVRIPATEVMRVADNDAITIDGNLVAIVHLSQVLDRPVLNNALSREEYVTTVVLGRHSQKIAFVVDDVISKEEVVLKRLGCQLKRVPNVTGGTIMGDGRVVIILNPTELLRSAQLGTRGLKPASAPIPDMPVRAKQILVVDDSFTSRTFEHTVLTSAGYEVDVAPDGREAKKLLNKKSYDLVLTDIQMPHVDGLELTAWIRSESSLRTIPVILVTHLESAEDKRRGLEVGADAYLFKSECDREGILDVVRQFL